MTFAHKNVYEGHILFDRWWETRLFQSIITHLVWWYFKVSPCCGFLCRYCWGGQISGNWLPTSLQYYSRQPLIFQIFQEPKFSRPTFASQLLIPACHCIVVVVKFSCSHTLARHLARHCFCNFFLQILAFGMHFLYFLCLDLITIMSRKNF
jgi:hypothetical protein